ncbi:hypothetical protein JCGZ_17277 [Jatropha curcas]|uniref:Bromo domain-containing protein n=1 Tax=Jatropha curcas TaxID=180498 RepID=A0A067LLM7_JATCU|nr:uncharacterized protein LOC105640568 isoform X2 [Jatropha curcas]KDP45670.1 hypothetical protein JCGZ_17277 [Jatropha curcas]
MRRKEAIAGSRRSARISALEEKARELALQRRAKQLAASSSPPLPLPAARKRGRKRKSLQSVVVNSVTPHKEGEDPKHEDNATKAEMENLSSSQGMPKKETLEFILDVLQRRDTQEIFAQPVDPQQVADYYNIIKEPMDFGTMRAKLQEGMYTSFEQFERDVFLISSNAMKFNSSTTVYYTEARAISELAERLFRSLRTEPESFQLEYTRTRRRSGKKPQVEVATDANKPSASKHGLPLNHKRVNYQPFAFKPRIGQTNNQFLSSKKSHQGNGRSLLNSSEIEKRMTYLPQNFFRTENDKIISSVYNMPKQLAHAPIACGQYRESLMQFVKDLGPAAQIAANKKLGKYFLQNPYSNQISNPSGSYKGKMVCTNGGLGEDANYSSSKANYNSDLLMASLMQISAVQDKANHTPSGSYYPLTGYENLPVPPPPPPPLPPLPPPSVMVSSSLLYPNGEAGPSNAVPAPAPAPAPAPSWGSPSMLLKGSTHQEMPSFRRMNYVQGEPIEELFWNPQAQQFNFMNGKLQPDLNLQL